MVDVPSPFRRDETDGSVFDAYDEFVPRNAPQPGEFLRGHDILNGRAHLAFHRLTRELFEERKVYDMTFNYNLARLNLDSRHGNAGFRYAEETGDPDDVDADVVDDGDRVLRAEFTPTTPFCPQSNTLTKGAFRAWNGLADRHEYDLVRVRVDPMHHRAGSINEELAALESSADGSAPDDGATETPSPTPPGTNGRDAGTDGGPAAPF